MYEFLALNVLFLIFWVFWFRNLIVHYLGLVLV